jgi:hypothetical protein
MKMSDFALLAASAAAVFLVLKARGLTGGGAAGSTWTAWNPVASYNGYQYFNDGNSGLVITPAGDYVLNGVTVWSPRGLG